MNAIFTVMIIILAMVVLWLLGLIVINKVKAVTGGQGMVGLVGVARTAIDPEGQVFVNGELWQAVSPMKIAPGESIRILDVDGLKLRVEAISPAVPRQASIVEISSEK
jgi:membrane-bound serine protease (ClpP class)